jgi:hypothetical protein
MSKTKHIVGLRTHAEKVTYILIGAVIVMAVGLVKERWLDTPDFGLEARICAPVVKVEAAFVNDKTGQVVPVPNPEGANPVRARFRNVGRKPLEGLEIVLEFQAAGGTRVSAERYATKPERGFGRVEIVGDEPNRSRIRIALLNPGDEVEYSAVGTRSAMILAYAKFPGLSFYQAVRPGCADDTWW